MQDQTETKTKAIERFQSGNEMQEYFKAHQVEIQQRMATYLDPERLLQIFLGSVTNNPSLMNCSKISLIKAAIECGRAGLLPDGYSKEAYLVPYFNKKKGVMEAQMMPGYMGLLKLAKNSGDVAKVTVKTVCEGDAFDFNYGTEAKLIHRTGKDRGKPIYFYAIVHFRDKDVSPEFAVMSIEECREHRDRFTKSRNKNGEIIGPWVDSFESMCKKTVLKEALKYVPLSTTLSEVMQRDDLRDLGKDPDVIDLPAINGNGTEPQKTGMDKLEESIKDEPETPVIDEKTGEVLEDRSEEPPSDNSVILQEYLDSQTRGKAAREKHLGFLTEQVLGENIKRESLLNEEQIDMVVKFLQKEGKL